MLMIKVELWPFGDESQKKTIATMKIVNDGRHPLRPKMGSYVVILGDKKEKIKHHNRKENVWFLVKKALDVLLSK